MVYYEQGEVALRAENVDRMIKNIAAHKFVIKNLVSLVKSNSWLETFYRESIRTMGSLQGIPRMSAFPADQVEWEKVSARQQKFGIESEVSWEDAMTNNIDVISRTLYRVGNRIAYQVDKHIYDTLTESDTPSNINTVATSAEWNHATRANRLPHEDIGDAITAITDSQLQSYTPDTILVSPKDYTYLVTNDYVMDAFEQNKSDLMKNGNMGKLLGLDVVISPTVTADKAVVMQSNIAATYKQVSDLTTATIREEGKRYTIRGWEIGVAQLTDPKAVCLITNTQA